MGDDDPVLRKAFDELLLDALGPDSDTDVDRVESLFGLTTTGPLRSLLSRRGGDHQLELGAWMVDSDADAYPQETERFANTPFEVVLGESWWLHAALADAIPIGKDGGGQIYLASLHEPHEVTLYDPGQAAVRFVASDLVTFTYLASLGRQADRLFEELELDDPEDADPTAPELQGIRQSLERIEARINLTDEIIATDFDEMLIGLTGLRPGFRPDPCITERLHDRADWLLAVLSMGYDSVSLDGIADTYDAERNDPTRWSSPGVRLYWLWHAFVLGEDERLSELLEALAGDPARLVTDSVRLVKTLHPIRSPEDAAPHLTDVLRSRRSLSTLWNRPPVALSRPKASPLPPEHQRRVSFLATEGYSRGDSLFAEEARECVAAIRHEGDRAVFAMLMACLDRPPAGGDHHPELNPVGAALLPFECDPSAKATLVDTLDYRSRDLLHLRLLPGVIRALGLLGAVDSVPKLLELLDEFAVAWQYGYAKAGNLAIVEAVCDALTRLVADVAIDPLVDLASRDPEVRAASGLRSQALVALARAGWSPPPEQLESWLGGAERPAALVLATRCGRPVGVDRSLDATPTTCLAMMCAGGAVRPAAEVALQTVFTDLFETELAHRMALHAIEQSLPCDEAKPVLERFVRIARTEGIRHTAMRLIRKHEPRFTATFCDRATVDAAHGERGPEGLVELLESPCPVFVHNVFGKAAETGSTDAIAPYLLPFAEDLAQYRHRWPRGLPDAVGTQYYAEIAALQAVGEPAATEAIETLWRSGIVGRERVEYVLADRGHEGVAAFEALLADQRADDANVTAAYGSGDHAHAIELASKIVARCPTNAAALRNLGHAYLMAGELDAAHDAYRRATIVEPGHAMGWYWASQASYQRERWPDVIHYARQGLAADPECLRCRFNLGLGLQATDQLEEAMRHYDRLTAADLGDEAWMLDDLGLNRATVLALQAKPEDAKASLRAVLARSPARLEMALGIDELVGALGREGITACAAR